MRGAFTLAGNYEQLGGQRSVVRVACFVASASLNSVGPNSGGLFLFLILLQEVKGVVLFRKFSALFRWYVGWCIERSFPVR